MVSLGNIFNIHLNNVFSEELEHLRFPRQRQLNGEECRSAEMKAIFQQKDLVVSHIYLWRRHLVLRRAPPPRPVHPTDSTDCRLRLDFEC